MLLSTQYVIFTFSNETGPVHTKIVPFANVPRAKEEYQRGADLLGLTLKVSHHE